MPGRVVELTRYALANLPDGAAAFAAAAVMFSGFWLAGRLLSRSSSADNVLVGWGAAYLLSVAAAYLGVTNLKIVIAALAGLVIIAVVADRQKLLRTRIASPALVLMLPVVCLGFVIPPLHVDSYLHWLPNAARLFQLDQFPVSPHPGFLSLHPTYPMAIPLYIYGASVLAGGFLELAGNAANVLLSLIAVMTVIDFIEGNAGTAQGVPSNRYAVPVVAFCAAVSLNPSFSAVNYWSATADPAMALVVMILAARWCSYVVTPERRIAGAPLDHSRDGARDLVVLFTMAALLAGMKNSGWLLALICAVAFSAVGIVERLEIRRLATSSLVVCGAAILSSLLWKAYVSKTSFPEDQFSIAPLAHWRFDLLDELAVAVLMDFRTHYVYYGLVFAVVVFGTVVLLRPGICRNRHLRVLMGFASLAMLMHMGALFLAYLGSGFSDDEIVRAASLQRYSTHIGFTVCALGLTALALALARYARAVAPGGAQAWGLTAAAVLYVFSFLDGIAVPTLRSADRFLQTRGQLRSLAEGSLSALPTGGRVAVAGAYRSARFFAYLAQIVPGAPEVAGVATIETESQWRNARGRYVAWMQDPGIGHIVLIDALSIAIDLGVGPHPDAIWSREGNQWRVLDLQRPDPHQF